jgi:hypothetical protein
MKGCKDTKGRNQEKDEGTKEIISRLIPTNRLC